MNQTILLLCNFQVGELACGEHIRQVLVINKKICALLDNGNFGEIKMARKCNFVPFIRSVGPNRTLFVA